MPVRLSPTVGCAVIFVANLFFAGILGANEVAQVAPFRACAEVENDIARLDCFDRAVADLSGDGEATEPASAQNAELAGPETPDDSDSNRVEVASNVTPKAKKYPPTRPETVQEADENMIKSCQFLGTVTGKSGWGGLAAGAASKGTMRSAKKKAAKLGATHVVFGQFNNGSGPALQMSNRQARAYRCPSD